MFFYLSKIIWSLITPLNFIWALALSGFVLRFWKRTLGHKILMLAGGLFLILGFLPVGYNAMALLERQYDRPNPMPKRVDGIIVLGGIFNSTIFDETNMIAANGSVNRIIDFVDLARRYPHAKLVFSGGSSSMLRPERKEADDAEKFLNMVGANAKRVTFERESRNSYENIKYTKELMKPKAGEQWILITSASHIPRVMGIAKHLEWDLTPYPSSPKTNGHYRALPSTLSALHNFHLLHTALKEFIGGAIYYFTGKSAFLLPLHSLSSEESSETASARE